MALGLEKTAKGAAVNYWRIEEVQLHAGLLWGRVVVFGYASQQAAESYRQIEREKGDPSDYGPLDTREVLLTAQEVESLMLNATQTNLTTEAYEIVKTREFFTEASDVL